MSYRFLLRIILALTLVAFASPSYAFWMWTPETNKWENPKYAVKGTPQEQLDHALEAYKVKDYKKATSELNKLISHYPKAREAAEAQYYLGVILEEQGDLYPAFKAYQVVIEKYPFSERSADIIDKQFAIGNQLVEGKGKKNKIVNVVVGGDYNVVDIYRTVIKNAPYGKNAAAAQYKIGLYLQEKDLFQESRDEFEKTINDYPDSEWAKAARYQIALSDAKRSSEAQYDQKVTQTAIEEFKTFVKDNPEADFSQAAKDEIHKLKEKEAENQYVVALFYEKQKKFEAAKTYYTTIVQDYKMTSWAQKALSRLQQIEDKKSR